MIFRLCPLKVWENVFFGTFKDKRAPSLAEKLSFMQENPSKQQKGFHPPGDFLTEIDLIPQLQQLVFFGGTSFIFAVSQTKRKKHKVE